MRVLELTGTADVFEIYPDPETALKDWSPPALRLPSVPGATLPPHR